MFRWIIANKDIIADVAVILGILGGLIAFIYKKRELIFIAWNMFISKITGLNKVSKTMETILEKLDKTEKSNSENYDVVMRKLNALEAGHNKINEELSPNSGRSLRDIVNQIAGLQWIKDNESDDMIFLADGKGYRVKISREYLRFTGRTAEETLGMGWVNSIAPKDKDRVMNEWKDAVDQRRDIDIVYAITDSNGNEVDVRCRGIRNIDSKGYITNYYGMIEVV